MKTIVAAAGVASFLLLIGASACTSSETSSEEPAGGSDASVQSDGGGGNDSSSTSSDAKTETSTKDSAPGECNALVNNAPESNASTVMGNAPTATGGTIADGTYFLTDFILYDPAGPAEAPSPSGLQVTMSIKGNQMDTIQTLPDASSDKFAETFVVSGTDLNRTFTCPKTTADLKATYSVAGPKLTIYETDPNSKLVAGSVYMKQ